MWIRCFLDHFFQKIISSHTWQTFVNFLFTDFFLFWFVMTHSEIFTIFAISIFFIHLVCLFVLHTTIVLKIWHCGGVAFFPHLLIWYVTEQHFVKMASQWMKHVIIILIGPSKEMKCVNESTAPSWRAPRQQAARREQNFIPALCPAHFSPLLHLLIVILLLLYYFPPPFFPLPPSQCRCTPAIITQHSIWQDVPLASNSFLTPNLLKSVTLTSEPGSLPDLKIAPILQPTKM